MLLNIGRRFLFYPDPPGGGGAGGGAPAFTPPDLKDPTAKAWFDTNVKPLVEQATSGLKSKNDELLAEKQRVSDEFKALQGKVASLGNIEDAGELLKKFRTDEELNLLKAGQYDQVFERRTREINQRHAQALQAEAAKTAAERKEREKYYGKVKELTVDRSLTEAAMKAGVHKTALPDVINRGRATFSLTDDFKIQAVDSSGLVISGPDNKPLTPETWMDKLKEEAPHFFPGSSGGGSHGNQDGPGNGEVIRIPVTADQKEFERLVKIAEKEGKRYELVQ